MAHHLIVLISMLGIAAVAFGAENTIQAIQDDGKGIYQVLKKACESGDEPNVRATYLKVKYADGGGPDPVIFNLGVEKTATFRCGGCGDEYRLHYLEPDPTTGELRYSFRTIKTPKGKGAKHAEWIGKDNRPSDFEVELVNDQGQMQKKLTPVCTKNTPPTCQPLPSTGKILCQALAKAEKYPEFTKFANTQSAEAPSNTSGVTRNAAPTAGQK